MRKIENDMRLEKEEVKIRNVYSALQAKKNSTLLERSERAAGSNSTWTGGYEWSPCEAFLQNC